MELTDVRYHIEDRHALERSLAEVLGPDRVFTQPADLIAYEYDARKGAFGAMGRLAPNYDLNDAVVPRSQLPAIMHQVMEIANRYGIFKVFPTPISCGELIARRAPRLAASGLWI